MLFASKILSNAWKRSSLLLWNPFTSKVRCVSNICRFLISKEWKPSLFPLKSCLSRVSRQLTKIASASHFTWNYKSSRASLYMMAASLQHPLFYACHTAWNRVYFEIILSNFALLLHKNLNISRILSSIFLYCVRSRGIKRCIFFMLIKMSICIR